MRARRPSADYQGATSQARLSRTVEIDVGGIGYQNNGAVWGKPMMMVGRPGGGRIITAVLLTVINPIDYDMNAQEAIDMRRFRKQLLPYLTNLENFAPSPDTRRILESMGHKFSPPQPVNHLALTVVGALLARDVI